MYYRVFLLAYTYGLLCIQLLADKLDLEQLKKTFFTSKLYGFINGFDSPDDFADSFDYVIDEQKILLGGLQLIKVKKNLFKEIIEYQL